MLVYVRKYNKIKQRKIELKFLAILSLYYLEGLFIA